jgi:hypothetical protein
MKRVRYIALMILLLQWSSAVFAQRGRSPVNDIMTALRTNRVEELGRYFDSFVPVTINNNQGNYSRNQAELVLRDFFDRNPPKDFKVMDLGSPEGTSQYGIATFSTPSGRYGVYVLTKMSGSNAYIKEIRINKE